MLGIVEIESVSSLLRAGLKLCPFLRGSPLLLKCGRSETGIKDIII